MASEAALAHRALEWLRRLGGGINSRHHDQPLLPGVDSVSSESPRRRRLLFVGPDKVSV